MSDSPRRSDDAAMPRIGGVEPFDAFFEREARWLLAVAGVVAESPRDAERAVRTALDGASRDWERVGSTAQPRTTVAEVVIGRAWPRRSRGDRAEAPVGVADLGDALRRLPRRRGMRAALAVLTQGVPMPPGDLVVGFPIDADASRDRALAALADHLGGADELESVVEVVRHHLEEQAAAPVPIDHLRPSAGGMRSGMRAAVAAAGVVAVALVVITVIRVVPPEPDDEVPRTTIATPGPLRVEIFEPRWWWQPQVTVSPTVALPGWELLTSGDGTDAWIHDAVSIGRDIVVWRLESIRTRMPTGDVAVFDTGSLAWRQVSPIPNELCHPHFAGLTAVGSEVVVRGYGDGDSRCSGEVVTLAYSPADDTWRAVTDSFFDGLGVDASMVWTGELLVAPFDAVALEWESGEVVPLPEQPTLLSHQRVPENGAIWTGERVVTVAANGVLAWAPGDAEWVELLAPPERPLGPPPVSTLIEEGLIVIDGGTVRLHDGSRWHDLPPFPSGCYFGQPANGDLALLYDCDGYLILDVAAHRWVPLSTPDVYGYHTVYGLGGAVYAFAADEVWRLPLRTDDEGMLLATPVVSVGFLRLTVPEGLEVDAQSLIPGEGDSRSRLSLAHTTTGDRCVVDVTGWHEHVVDDPGPIEGESIIVPRDGVPSLRGTGAALPGDEFRLAIDTGIGGPAFDAVVTCRSSTAGDARSLAIEVAAGLWHSVEGHRSWHAVSDGPDTLIEYRDRDTGLTEVSYLEYPALPDRERSTEALAGFLACMEPELDGITLVTVSVITDSADGLLALTLLGVRPDALPPIAILPDALVEACLASAGVTMPYEYQTSFGPRR
jgi:hypothetical protein